MNDMTPMAGMGHNGPPGPFIPEELDKKAAQFIEVAGLWLDRKVIADEEQAQKANDFVAGAKQVEAELEAERKAQKKPHDDAAKAVQEVFAPRISRVKSAHQNVGSMLAKFLSAKREREAEEKRQREAEARRQQEDANRLAAEAAARNDIAGMADAEEAAKAAAKQAKAAAKPIKTQVGSATGAAKTGSLRTYWFAKVNPEARGPALARYRDHPKVIELIESLATAEVRAMEGEKAAPHGFILHKEEKF